MARDQWDSRIAFVLASIGSAIGLGNIWRFPYVCFKFGGGAFLIAYLVALFTVGIPLLMLEFSLGHKTESAAPRAFKKVNKKLEFFGWGAVCVAFVITTYYAVVMAWCFYYGVSATTLAWGDNPHQFFYGEVLRLTSGPLEFGLGNPLVLAGLLAAWVFIVLSIWKGAKTVGKVVYLTVLLPWLLLLIFVVRGVTLPGAVEGLNFYLTPDFAMLLQPEVWLQAYTQVFFSVSLGFGIMIAYASFLPRTADISNNAFLIGLADAATAFIGGLAVFGALGFHAHRMGQDLDIWMSEVRSRDDVAAAAVAPPEEEKEPYLAYLVPAPALDEEEAKVLDESPHLLLARDLEEGFLEALAAGESPIAKRLANALPDPTRERLAGVTEGRAPPAGLVDDVVAALNAGLRAGTLLDAEALADTELDEEQKALLEGIEKPGEDMDEEARHAAHQANAAAGRTLLVAALPELVAPSYPTRASGLLSGTVKGFTGTVEYRIVATLPDGVSQTTKVPVQVVTSSGPGLTFVTYPTIINHLPVAPQLFGVLFFLMLLTLAVDSAFSLVEAAAASLRDKWGWSHTRSNLSIAAVGLLLGVPFALGFGLYWLDIVDRFITQFGLTVVCLGQCLLLGWAVKSERDRPAESWDRMKRALPWAGIAFAVTAIVITALVLLSGQSVLARSPVIVIGADAVALFVLLVAFTRRRGAVGGDPGYVEDLRQYANQQSDFRLGRWWNFLVRFVAPVILFFLIVQEIRARIQESYEGYPRLATFLGGWLLLHIVVVLAFVLMAARARTEETE